MLYLGRESFYSTKKPPTPGFMLSRLKRGDMRHHRRLRPSGRFSQRQITYQALQPTEENSVKGGNLFVDEIRVVGEKTPGSTVTMEVDVANGALLIQASDPDRCDNSANPCESPGPPIETAGYCSAVTFTPAWAGLGDTILGCPKLTTIGVGIETITNDIVLPASPGTYEVDVTLAAAGSNEQVTMSQIINVQDDGSGGGNGGGGGGGGCGTDGDCPEGQVCRDGQCVPQESPLPSAIPFVIGLGAIGAVYVYRKR